MLPEQAALRLVVEQAARGILEAAGYRRIETPIFEDTEVFRRTVGESTDIVQKEMYTFEDGGGRSLTLRPEVTAPIVRSYLEHGMHTLPQPVKLWYLGPCFRYERAQAGPLPPVLADRRRGDRLRRPGRRRRVDPAARRAARGARRARRCACAWRASARRPRAPPTASCCRRTCARTRTGSSDDVRARIDLNPLRAFDSDHPGTREVMATAPLLMDHLDADDAEHFAAVRAMLDAVELPYEIDGVARARPGLLHAHRLRVHERRARRAERRRRRRALRRPRRAARRRPHARHGLGGGRRADAAGRRGAPRSRAGLRPLRRDGGRPRGAGARRRSRWPPRRAAPACPTQVELAGRSLKGQFKQAARLQARYVAVLGDEGIELKDMESGEQETVESGSAVVARVLRGRHAG